MNIAATLKVTLLDIIIAPRSAIRHAIKSRGWLFFLMMQIILAFSESCLYSLGQQVQANKPLDLSQLINSSIELFSTLFLVWYLLLNCLFNFSVWMTGRWIDGKGKIREVFVAIAQISVLHLWQISIIFITLLIAKAASILSITESPGTLIGLSTAFVMFWQLVILLFTVQIVHQFKSISPAIGNLMISAILPFIIGLIAAIAMPAYYDYQSRSFIFEGINASKSLQTKISEHMINHNGQPPSSTFPIKFLPKRVIAITQDNKGRLIIEYDIKTVNGENSSLIFTPHYDATNNKVSWSCYQGNLKQNLRPAYCRKANK